MDLLDAWSGWSPTEPPYIFDADRPFLASRRSSDAVVNKASWEEAYRSDDFADPNDTRLHVGVLPHPYFGDVRRASVYVLLLNPGLGPSDYYGEYKVPAYRDALLAVQRQEFRSADPRFMHLDPQFGWHGGFDYWHRKFAALIGEIAKGWGIPFAMARRLLADELACIQLLPYHSKKFRDADGWLQKLPSVDLARTFAHDAVLPRARSGEAIVIVTRQPKRWGLPSGNGVITYPRELARGASLTPQSPRGQAILDHLKRAS